MRREPRRRPLQKSVCLAALACCSVLRALPEDAAAPILIEGGSFSGSLEAGWSTLKQTDSNPARITQGSLLIEGDEIRIFSENNQVVTVIATGMPARFQQQPTIDKAVIQGRAEKITLENKTRLVALTLQVELNQNDILYRGTQMDYNLDTHQLDGTGVHMSVPPQQVVP